jgi:hypothetical protein
MSDTEQATSIDANSFHEVRSPLSPSSLFKLLFRPKLFFADIKWLNKAPEILIVVWASGVTYTLGRIDTNIMRAELGHARAGWETLGPWLTESWLHFWAFTALVGIISGVIFWYLGGWWYRKRLNWSGARDADPALVRPVYMYQDFVLSAPAILITLLQTALFSSYQEAWETEEYWSSTILIFTFWACFTSYKAATTAFTLSKWKARTWFLILPIMIYLTVFGVIGTLYALFGGHST